MRRAAVLVVLLLSPPVRADMIAPGFRTVPHDFEFEVDREYPDLRFWLASERGFEPLPVAPGRPYRVDGADRHGSHRSFQVIAAPTGVVEKVLAVGGADPRKAAEAVLAAPGVITSEGLDFYGAVPFYDSRDRIVDRYRVEVGPPDRVRVVWAGQNAPDPWRKAAWAVAGASAAVAVLWGGWVVVGRLWRSTR